MAAGECDSGQAESNRAKEDKGAGYVGIFAERLLREGRHPSGIRESCPHVSGIEADLGTRYTAQTLRHLRRRHPGVRFVWLMGADNLTHFHRWKDWQQILDTVPVGVLARPGDRISARFSPAARIYRHAMLKGSESQLLARADSPAWCFVNLPMVDVSSTALRARGEWSAAQQG